MTDRWIEIRQTIGAFTRLNKVVSLVISLGIPTLIGILATYYADLAKITPVLFWIIVSILLVVVVALSWATADIRHAPELWHDLMEAEKQIKSLKHTAEYLTLLQEQILVWSAMMMGYLKNPDRNAVDLHRAVSQICSILVEDRDGFFGFRTRELWNFVVYIYDPAKDRLVPVWREKHQSHPSKGPGREWKPGQGHVGHAFNGRETIITSDAMGSDVRDLLTPPHEALVYDAKTYRSFVSEPIGPVDGEKQPIGVLVATSNEAGRFDRGNALVLRHAASAIATLVRMAYTDTVVAELARCPCKISVRN